MKRKIGFIEGTILGLLVGVAAGLLFAPYSGHEMRNRLRKIREDNEELIRETKEKTDSLIEKTLESIEQGFEKLSEVVENRKKEQQRQGKKGYASSDDNGGPFADIK